MDVAEVLAATDRQKRVRFVCVDQDEEAIAFGQSLLANAAHDGAVAFLKANVLRLHPCPDSPTALPFDIVYSVGLFDYVPDRLASIALRNWWRMVAPGGRLLLTVKDRDRYDPTYYDWMADWTFIPRTERDFVRLVLDSLDLPQAQLDLLREETGVSIVGVVHKQS